MTEIYHGDCLAILPTLPAESVDVIISNCVINLSPDKRQTFAEVLRMLKPGGRLVYATCSLLPDEGECQIEEALERHPGLRVIPAEAPWIEPDWRSEEGGLRLRPDFWAARGGMDGFYMACVTKD